MVFFFPVLWMAVTSLRTESAATNPLTLTAAPTLEQYRAVIGRGISVPDQTGLICFIFAWNEFLFAVNLIATRAATAPVFPVGFVSGEGLFLACLCASATFVSLPVVIAGCPAQDKLVRGPTLGAVI